MGRERKRVNEKQERVRRGRKRGEREKMSEREGGGGMK